MSAVKRFVHTEQSEESREKEDLLKDAELLLYGLGEVIPHLLNTSRPSEIIATEKMYADVKLETLNDVKTYTGYLISFDYTIHPSKQIYQFIKQNLYAARTFYTYMINFTKERGEVVVGRRRSKGYMAVNGKVIDEYPPRTLQGWIVVASLYGEDDIIPSVVVPSIPYDEVLRKLAEFDPKAEKILGHVTTYKFPGGTFTVYDLENLLTSDTNMFKYSVLSVGGVNLLNPSWEAVKTLSLGVDFATLKKDLLKIAVGVASFYVNKRINEEQL